MNSKKLKKIVDVFKPRELYVVFYKVRNTICTLVVDKRCTCVYREGERTFFEADIAGCEIMLPCGVILDILPHSECCEPPPVTTRNK